MRFKIYIKKIDKLVIIILCILVISYMLKFEILSYYHQFKYRSPVIFNNIEVKFPKEMIYNAGQNNILINIWNENDSYIYIDASVDLSNRSIDYFTDFYQKKNYTVIETNNSSYKGFQSFSISFVDDLWCYNRAIFIVPKNIIIIYVGTKEKYDLYFNDIIQSLKFI